MNTKNTNLQEGKFEVSEQEYFWIWLNYDFFEHFQKTMQITNF